MNACHITVSLFHRRTSAYNGCLAWYNVVLTPRVHSSVKCSQLGQTNNICDVSDQQSRTCTLQYPNWLYSMPEWCNTSYTPDIRCRHWHSFSHYSGLNRILSYTADDYDDSLVDWTHVDKLDCSQRAVCQRRENFVTPATDSDDSCDGGMSVLNNCLSLYKFVYTHLYHSRQCITYTWIII